MLSRGVLEELADMPGPPTTALPWRWLAALGASAASSLPACLESRAELCGTTAPQSMLEREGSPLLITFLLNS